MNPQSSQQPLPGTLSWRLSSHPITLLTFLVFRICPSPRIVPTSSLQNYKLTISIHISASLLVYLLGLQFSSNLCVTQPTPLPPSQTNKPRAQLTPPPFSPQRPNLHPHHPPPRNRLLLSQEHRRPTPSRSPLVERVPPDVDIDLLPLAGLVSLGLRIRLSGRPPDQRDRQSIFLASALHPARAVGRPGRRGHPASQRRLAQSRRHRARADHDQRAGFQSLRSLQPGERHSRRRAGYRYCRPRCRQGRRRWRLVEINPWWFVKGFFCPSTHRGARLGGVPSSWRDADMRQRLAARIWLIGRRIYGVVPSLSSTLVVMYRDFRDGLSLVTPSNVARRSMCEIRRSSNIQCYVDRVLCDQTPPKLSI